MPDPIAFLKRWGPYLAIGFGLAEITPDTTQAKIGAIAFVGGLLYLLHRANRGDME